jgi:GAF domain-containing protein
MSSDAERHRKQWRWCPRERVEGVKIDVDMRSATYEWRGTQSDLSREGAQIRHPGPAIPPGTFLRVTLCGGVTAYQLSAISVYSVETETGVMSTGIMFCRNNRDLVSLLKYRFAERYLRRNTDLLRGALGVLLRHLKQRVGADVVTLRLYNEPTSRFYLPIAFGLQHPEMFLDPAMVPGTDREIGNILKSETPCERYEPGPDSAMAGPFMKLEGIKCAIGFRIAHETKKAPLGVVFLNYRRDTKLTELKRRIFLKTIAIAASEVWNRTSNNRELTAHSDIWHRRDTNSVKRRSQAHVADPLCRLAIQVLNRPLAIWRLAKGGKWSRWGAVGVPLCCLSETVLPNSEGACRLDALCHTVSTKEVSVSTYLSMLVHTTIPGFCDTVLMSPVRYETKMVGVMVLFAPDKRDFAGIDNLSLSHIVNLIADALLQHSLIARLREKPGAVSSQLQYSTEPIMRWCVDQAERITLADSAALFLWDETNKRFHIGAKTSSSKINLFSELPRRDGLTSKILKDGTSYITGNGGDELAQKTLSGSKSLIGVPMSIDQVPVGVLYVRGVHNDQFLGEHVTWLRELAEHTGLGLRRAQALFRSLSKLDAAIADIHNPSTWDKLCVSVQERFGFAFISLHIVHRDAHVVETVCTRSGEEITLSISRHSLVTSKKYRDIQADVAQAWPPRIEIIDGWDDRYDRWVYDRHGHCNYSRLWVPIVVLRNAQGQLADCEWLDNWAGESRTETSASNGDRRVTITMAPPKQVEQGYQLETIGVIDAGFIRRAAELDEKLAWEVVRFINKRSVTVYATCLSHVLSLVAEEARKSVDAHSTVLIFPWATESIEPEAIIATGHVSRPLVVAHPPRRNGIGAQALSERKPTFIPNAAVGHSEDELSLSHRHIYNLGIRAMLALPLLAGGLRGVLYVYHERNYFREDEIKCLSFYSKKGEEAIERAAQKVAEREMLIMTQGMRAFTDRLADKPEAESLLTDIAGYTASMLAADVVIVAEVEYQGSEYRTEVSVIGKLANTDEEVVKELLTCTANEAPPQTDEVYNHAPT